MTEIADAPAFARPSTAPAQGAGPSPLIALRRHKLLGAAVAVVGLGLGIGAAIAQGNSFTAESRLAVGGNSLTEYAIPAYAEAAQELASDYAGYVGSASEKDSLLGPLGASASKVTSVSATAIPLSATVAVDVTAKDQATALAGANEIASNLSAEIDAIVATTTPAATLNQLQTLIQQVGNEQTVITNDRTVVAHATGRALTAAKAKLDADSNTLQSMEVQQTALSDKYESLVENPTQSGVLNVTQPAQITQNDLHSRLERYGLVGLVLGFGLALFASIVTERRKARRSARAAAKPALT